MNTQQAKLISLPDLLGKLGHYPVKEAKQGKELWYRSPFRDENEPSFHTSFLGGKWIWNDFGDTGGTVIDFVMRYKEYSSIKDALDFLAEFYQPNIFSPAPNSFSFQQQPRRGAAENFLPDRSLELISVSPIKNHVILQYLTQERGIAQQLIKHYLKEIHYRNQATQKEYFAFGMLNQSQGYEIRVATNRYSFKSALNARDVTMIQGKDPKTVAIFEGMTDFLSWLMFHHAEEPPQTVIVMHSLSSYNRTVEIIKNQGFVRIETYLDNNPAGQKTTQRFIEDFEGKAISKSASFAPHIDLNDAWQATLKKSSDKYL